ncbi:serine hydrolase [Nocardia terpenica]|uniref:serine hydrolase domain-containing protein n=1 Tax=Nocardia terpenica TaxID=455432 RepID=UPI001892E65D|nr:serine hydrolase domain-containing protein [Nocardia terpenica]MBF6059250.1 serine hydrolase [Nocardia terpenica]MBF6103211.1 serine hydrolase [Nocardia terpenica]MBF6110600.1 serine hydrolase [Nocardia terpenica]MBF6116731.1 serine hydrolase [Nocardia terpenica]
MTSDRVTVTTSGGRTLAELIPHEGPVLRYGTPDEARLLPPYADRTPVDAAAGLRPGTGDGGHPMYPGEVVIAGRDGVIAEFAADGYNLLYANHTGDLLPSDRWIETTTDTIFDLASLTKLFTATVSVRLMQQGRLALHDTVVKYLPDYASHGKSDITILQLLTHTSGLPPDPTPPLWTYATRAEKIAAILATVPQSPAGSAYLYSDLNFLSLQQVVETITGRTLDVLVRDGITAPLGMTDTMFNPPAALKHRIAAEEYQLTPDRGLVWGQVHDENAWALGGVAGHAGLFSTAHDMAIFVQTLLNGGTYGDNRILSRDSVIAMLTNYNQAFPGNDHGLGIELYQMWEAGALATPYGFAHTGFTGTSLAGDPTTGAFVILLTNRVHPSRDWGSTNPARAAVGDDMARAVAVCPATDCRAWFGGMTDNTTASLMLPITLPAAAHLEFALWYDTEPGCDFFFLESSRDNGATWQPIPFGLTGDRLDVTTPGQVSGYEGRQWLTASAPLTGLTGPVRLRWRYTTDPQYHGRGVYVSAIRITAGAEPIFDDRIDGDAAQLVLDGFTETTD